jgi:hypothetical protein
MKTVKQIILAVLVLVGLQSIAQQTPAANQKEIITITGATAHLGNGATIENSVLVFETVKLSRLVI